MPTDKEIVDLVKDRQRDYNYLRQGFERDWYRNLLFRQGHQWIVYDGVSRRFRQKKLKSWIPTPVTNKFASIVDTLVALILRVEPALQWKAIDPNDETEKAIAETATKVIDFAKEQTHFKLWRQELANWIAYTGNGYLVNYYDAAGGGKIKVPYHKCDVCNFSGLPSAFENGCEQCGSYNCSYDVGSDGLPREEEFDAGRVRTEVATPFETYFDFTIPQWISQPDVIIGKERTLDYFKRYGARGKKVQAGRSSTLSEFYANALAYMSAGSSVSPGGFTSASRRPTAQEIWYCRLPDDEFPKGLYAIVGGDELLVKEDLHCRNATGDPFLPVTQFLFDPIPGSGVGKTVASDLAPKQKQRNELESLIQLITMRSANPVWIVPYGTDVEGFSGQPGAVLKSIQISPTAGGEPKRLPGENIPGSVMTWLDKIDSDMEEMAATFDVLKGNAPPGVVAGYALQLLIERGQSRWGPLFQRWENGMLMWGMQVTSLVKSYMPTDALLDLMGPHGQFDVSKFKEGLNHRIGLQVEAGSNRPTSVLAEQAMLDNLMAKGIINPMDPATKSEILRLVGMAKYDNNTDWDMKDAAREEEGFSEIAKSYDLGAANTEIQTLSELNPEAAQAKAEQWQMIAQSAVRYREQIDNHAIHLWAHRRFAKTDAFMKLPAEWQAVWIKHIEQHAMRLMMESQMMQGGAPANRQPGAPSTGGEPQQPASATGGAPAHLPASPQGGHVMNPATMGA